MPRAERRRQHSRWDRGVRLYRLFGAHLLSGGLNPRLIQLLGHLTIFDQPPAQLQQSQHLMRQPPQGFDFFEGELSRLEIQNRENPQRITLVSDAQRIPSSVMSGMPQ